MAAEYNAQATAIYEPFEEDISDQEMNDINSPPDIPARTSTPGTSVHNGYRSNAMNPPTVPSKPVMKGTSGPNGVRPGTLSGGISYRNAGRNSTTTAGVPSVDGINVPNDMPSGNGPEGRRSGTINPQSMNGMSGVNPYRTQSMKRSYPHIDTELVKEKALRRSRSAVTVTANPEALDKTDTSSQDGGAKSDWRKSIGNPTPIGLLGTIISLAPLSCDLMGWGGATGGGQASIGAYYFFGGMLLSIGGLLEFILGNTFSFVVDMTFSAFWLTLGATLQPSFNAIGAYSTDGTPQDGQVTQAFNSSFAFILLFMGILSTVYLVCSLRTNVCFVVIFFTLALGFGLLTGQHLYIGSKDLSTANTLGIAAGADLFVTCIAALWIFVSIMLEVLDFPFKIPVGDLSNFIKSNTVRMEEIRYLEDLRHIEEMRYMDKRQMQDMRYMM